MPCRDRGTVRALRLARSPPRVTYSHARVSTFGPVRQRHPASVPRPTLVVHARYAVAHHARHLVRRAGPNLVGGLDGHGCSGRQPRAVAWAEEAAGPGCSCAAGPRKTAATDSDDRPAQADEARPRSSPKGKARSSTETTHGGLRRRQVRSPACRDWVPSSVSAPNPPDHGGHPEIADAAFMADARRLRSPPSIWQSHRRRWHRCQREAMAPLRASRRRASRVAEAAWPRN